MHSAQCRDAGVSGFVGRISLLGSATAGSTRSSPWRGRDSGGEYALNIKNDYRFVIWIHIVGCRTFKPVQSLEFQEIGQLVSIGIDMVEVPFVCCVVV